MKVFVGYDSREEAAYNICKHSILRRCKKVEVIPLKLNELKERGLLTRDYVYDLSSETSISRFLVPHLMNYEGWAVYIDSSVLVQFDVTDLFIQAEEQYAALMVKDNVPRVELTNIVPHRSIVYPKGNVVVWNCGHPLNKRLTVEKINTEIVDHLQAFGWLPPESIGPINHSFNWIIGVHSEPRDGTPKGIDFIRGGPWIESEARTEYGAMWEREKADYVEANRPMPAPGPFDHVPPDIEKTFKDILKYRVDPSGEVYGITEETVIEDVKMLNNNNAVAVDGGRDPTDGKGLGWDPYMESFILGSGGQITNYDKIAEAMTPVVFRGITKAKHMRACLEKGRDFYYIDTGYFGNVRKKFYHRITKNAMQNVGPVIERPFDRLELTGWRPTKFRKGRNILLCPPSAKAMSAFGLDLDVWMEETISTIKKHSDRPIVIRKKVSRRERTSTDTMEMALSQDVHCLVTFNSIAATEALLLGKPAFTLGPNAAHAVSLSDLTQIETPHIPTLDEVSAWAAHLAYCQFSEAEMKDGTAWRILNEK